MPWEQVPPVTCFYKDGDLLSQWRSYGLQGYAISLERALFAALSPPASGLVVRDMIYKKSLRAAVNGTPSLTPLRRARADKSVFTAVDTTSPTTFSVGSRNL